MGIVFKNVKITGTLPSGTGDDLLTHDPSSKDLGAITSGVTSLATGYIFVGNGSNLPTAVPVSGDITITSGGVVAIATGVIVNADISASAAIALTKLAAVTASKAIVSDGSGILTASSVTATELGYVSGVTSALQTQLNGKQATITGGASTIATSNLAANFALISDGAGKVIVSGTTTTEIGYLSGTTSNVQTQLTSKLTATVAGAAQGAIIYNNGSIWTYLPKGTNGQALYSTASTIQWNTPTINGIPVGGSLNQVLSKNSGTDFDASWTTLNLARITDVTATATEVNKLSGVTTTAAQFNYLNTATSDLQSQINSKLSTALAQNAMFVGNSSSIASVLVAGSNGQVLTISGGVPTWMTLSGTGSVTSVQVSGGTTGLSFTGGPVTTTGTITASGTLIVANGGTGLTSLTTGDIIYASGTTTFSKLGIGTNGYVLKVSGGLPSWQPSSSGITNSAISTELMLSDGTNAVPSGLFTSGTSGSLQLGGASFSGTERTFAAEGSGSDIGFRFTPKGSGQFSTSITGTGYHSWYKRNSGTSDIVVHSQFERQSSGTVANGFGLFNAIRFQNASGSVGDVSRQSYSFTDATNGSEDILIDFQGIRNGALATAWSWNNNNFSFFTNSGSYGGGEKVVFIPNSTTIPTTNPTGGGILYVESGALKFKGSSGTVTTIAPA
jgi:hypothetical protein